VSEAARKLLLALSAHASCSGSELAIRAGVTRAAVWKQVEALREAGVVIDARAGSGYRLSAPIELLDVQRIVEYLPAPVRDRLGPIAVHWSLDSTNSELLRRASTDAQPVAACLAERQTRGRGRRGRAWHTPLAGGLALSLRWRFDAGMASLAGLSLATGVAVVEALEACDVRNVALKWPNDVVADGRKLAGILVELAGDALGPCHAVIGIGINLRLDAAVIAAIDQPVTDLATLAGTAMPGRNAFAASVLAHLVAAMERFAAHGFAAFAEGFDAHDALRGRRVLADSGGGRREGIAAGVDALGRLRVTCDDADIVVDSGEVSVRAA
jgi:BirA family biotin operon repressor/biotin-[acetyl-CoA-carboxylase] ligase